MSYLQRIGRAIEALGAPAAPSAKRNSSGRSEPLWKLTTDENPIGALVWKNENRYGTVKPGKEQSFKVFPKPPPGKDPRRTFYDEEFLPLIEKLTEYARACSVDPRSSLPALRRAEHGVHYVKLVRALAEIEADLQQGTNGESKSQP